MDTHEFDDFVIDWVTDIDDNDGEDDDDDVDDEGPWYFKRISLGFMSDEENPRDNRTFIKFIFG